jgi:hypothetical protein
VGGGGVAGILLGVGPQCGQSFGRSLGVFPDDGDDEGVVEFHLRGMRGERGRNGGGGPGEVLRDDWRVKNSRIRRYRSDWAVRSGMRDELARRGGRRDGRRTCSGRVDSMRGRRRSVGDDQRDPAG